MRSLWLAWMPLLYLPNLGMGGKTSYGTLELSDFLIGPFLVLLAIADRSTPQSRSAAARRVAFPLIAFAGWALLSTLLISERYGYVDQVMMVGGLLKLGKLVLYGLAGAMVAGRLFDDRSRRNFEWSLLACSLVVGVGLIMSQDPGDAFRPTEVPTGYKTANAVSAMMAVLLCYQGAGWMCGRAAASWRMAAGPALLVMTIAFFLSHGRGGWLAAIAGCGYLLFRIGLGSRLLIGVAAAAAITLVAYSTLPDFREDLDRTLWPDQDVMSWNHSGVGGIDDGARMSTWIHELDAMAKSPALGSGFYHRGGSSGLWGTGSHNFFLQMFLETGLVGGLLILEAYRRMWQAAGADPPARPFDDVATRCALVAGFVAGLSGEYYYGGLVLFNLLVVMAPACSGGSPPVPIPTPVRRRSAFPDAYGLQT